MRALRFVLVSSMIAASSMSPSAIAQPRPSSSGTASADAAALARRYYEDGVAAAADKEWVKAYNAFLEAWRLKQHWQIAVNLGQAELRLGKNPDAAEHLAYYLREATELHPDDVKQAAAWLEQARSKVGVLRLNVAPKGAQVFVDGKLVGTAPIEHETYVETGWHAIEARTADQKALRQVEAPAGMPVDVLLGVGGAVPVPRPEATAAPESTSAPLLPAGIPPRTLILAGVGAVALVNLIVGAATAGASASKGAEQDQLCKPTCPQSRTVMNQWNQLEQDRVSAANASMAGFVFGGLAAAGTVAAYVLLRPKPAAAPAPVTAVRVGVTAGGISLSGSF